VKLSFQDSEIFERASQDFDQTALEVFAFQYHNNSIYKKFCDSLKRNPSTVKAVEGIPFLPVEFFKTQKIYSATEEPEIVFTSSGTTGSITSSHFVRNKRLYELSCFYGFEKAYGSPKDCIFLFLLPSYLEREGSSLVYMAEQLSQWSIDEDTLRENPEGLQSFFLHNYRELAERLLSLNHYNQGKKVILIGVTYALLDLAEQFPQEISNIIIMETGGMKGKRKELTREELHDTLQNAFSVSAIHSEYGMTELLSQAYSKGNGIFKCPPWMKILIRETNDPLSWCAPGKTGGVSIIDLANIYSCSFISTSDLGKLHADDSFEILGRFDFSDTRGCNLLYQ
jgi:phenylacetate-coenzyme A ligase PaaK-like adenylate-forming protein